MMMRAQTEILFSRWVTLTEQKWISFHERRSGIGRKTRQYNPEIEGAKSLGQ